MIIDAAGIIGLRIFVYTRELTPYILANSFVPAVQIDIVYSLEVLHLFTFVCR